jgi:hypothetical protein
MSEQPAVRRDLGLATTPLRFANLPPPSGWIEPPSRSIIGPAEAGHVAGRPEPLRRIDCRLPFTATQLEVRVVVVVVPISGGRVGTVRRIGMHDGRPLLVQTACVHIPRRLGESRCRNEGAESDDRKKLFHGHSPLVATRT